MRQSEDAKKMLVALKDAEEVQSAWNDKKSWFFISRGRRTNRLTRDHVVAVAIAIYQVRSK